MKNITEFKKCMTVGSKWEFSAHWYIPPVVRTCAHSQSNSFALTSPRDGVSPSWCDWPKKSEVTFDGDTVLIKQAGWPEGCYLRYTLLK